MRTALAAAFVVLIAGLSPAAAMCGGGQQSSAQAAMCGRADATDPLADKPAMSPRQSGMSMCGCCKQMAAMDGMNSAKPDDPHKGMDMPK